MSQVKWGVIGVGGIALRRTLPGAVVGSPRAKFVAVMDVRAEAVLQAAQQFHIARSYTDEQELLSDPGVQAVYIATPVHLHAQHIKMAAEAGKHVLCEKPITLTIEQAEESIETCKKAGVLLGVAYMMRFHSLNAAARDLVARGDLGRVVAGRAQLTCWYPPMPGSWRQDPETGLGGSLADLGSHCIDLLEFITGSKVVSVCAMNHSLVHDYRSEDTSTVLLRMDNGAQMMVASLFNVPDAASRGLLEIYGTKGALYGEGTIGQMPTGKITAMLSDQSEYDAQQEREPSSQTFDLEAQPIDMYAAEIEDFSRAVLEGRPPAVPGEEGLWNVEVLDACYRSSRERREIELTSWSP